MVQKCMYKILLLVDSELLQKLCGETNTVFARSQVKPGPADSHLLESQGLQCCKSTYISVEWIRPGKVLLVSPITRLPAGNICSIYSRTSSSPVSAEQQPHRCTGKNPHTGVVKACLTKLYNKRSAEGSVGEYGQHSFTTRLLLSVNFKTNSTWIVQLNNWIFKWKNCTIFEGLSMI